MSDLSQILQDYLLLRRSLGFKLEREAALLPDLIGFLQKAESPFITPPLAVAWATRPARATTNWWATRLGMVRTFARYAHTVDPQNQVPSPELLPPTKRRPPPYIYLDIEVAALLAATRRIGARFRGDTYLTLIGLLASTGMRVGEAIALDRTDLDRQQGVLTIRDSKFGKSREVPLHPTTLDALERYAHQRDRWFGRRESTAYFVSLAGTRLCYTNVHLTCFRLVDSAGLADRKPHRPRIHDLRHTFAVRTLIHWYEMGVDVERQLPVLSTYLGHVSPSSTYWYLSAVPELMDVAARRLEQSLGELP